MTSLGRIPSYIRRVYIHFGFPMSEWPTRYKIDFPHGCQPGRAQRSYKILANSIATPSGNRERAHSRYYERKIRKERRVASNSN